MIDAGQYALLLRFRDLVTEPGGNIAEHRQIIRQRGYAWWGWWARQREKVPRNVLERLFPSEAIKREILLFDSGMMRLYRTSGSKVVVAPSHLGVNSPDFEATPEYYVRGRYPAWFRLEEDISIIEASSITIAGRPTIQGEPDDLLPVAGDHTVSLEKLSDEGPTLWVAIPPGR